MSTLKTENRIRIKYNKKLTQDVKSTHVKQTNKTIYANVVYRRNNPHAIHILLNSFSFFLPAVNKAVLMITSQQRLAVFVLKKRDEIAAQFRSL